MNGRRRAVIGVSREHLAKLPRHPRHVVLFAAVAGLLLGASAPALIVIAMAGVAALLGARLPLALAAAVAVLAGAALAQARLAALDAGALPGFVGRSVEGRAILLEPVRMWRNGTAVARVRLSGIARVGPRGYDLDGEIAVVHVAHERSPRGLRVGSVRRY